MIAASSGAADLGPLGDRLLAAVDTPGFAPLALAVAFAAGAAHACAPGHGKSLAAAYLIGAHGRRRDAVLLGAAVATMHTFSVIVVGMVWVGVSASGVLATGPLGDALSVIAGVLIVVAGLVLVRRRRRHHEHHHHGPSEHGPRREARPGLVLLGASGGLMPSPAAFLVLLTGLFSGRTVLAFVLVLAFGVGMAAVLVLVGLATLSGRDLLARLTPSASWTRRAARIAPALAAWSVLVAGCVLTAVALAATPLV